MRNLPARATGAGELPGYLKKEKRQQARADAHYQQQMDEPYCPPGKRLVPEQERRQTMQKLKADLKLAQRAVDTLPMVLETPAHKRREEAAIKRLKQVEKAISFFSNTPVYVPLNVGVGR